MPRGCTKCTPDRRGNCQSGCDCSSCEGSLDRAAGAFGGRRKRADAGQSRGTDRGGLKKGSKLPIERMSKKDADNFIKQQGDQVTGGGKKRHYEFEPDPNNPDSGTLIYVKDED